MTDKFDRYFSNEDQEIWENVFREFKAQQHWNSMELNRPKWTEENLGLPQYKWDDTIREFRSISKDIINMKEDKSKSAQHLTPKMTAIHYWIVITGRISRCKNPKKKALATQCLDLIRAINTYRDFKTVEKTIEKLPELAGQLEAMTKLFSELDKLNTMEMADLAMAMIQELEEYLEGTK